MKILIVTSPRSGSTYLLNVLAHAYKNTILSSLNDNFSRNNSIYNHIVEDIMDEPFSEDYTPQERKQKFDKLMKMDAWVVKMHFDHITDNSAVSERWTTRLIKNADLVVKLTRKNYYDQAKSLCIAEVLNNWGENHKQDIFIDKSLARRMIAHAYFNQIILEYIPADIVIDYDELKSPMEIVERIIGVDMGILKWDDNIPEKNTATIKNIDEVEHEFHYWVNKMDQARNPSQF